MKRIYFNELVDFVNLENINFMGSLIRKGTNKFNENDYNINHGIIQNNIAVLKDIHELGEAILGYPMGMDVQLVLLNIIMQAKGEIIDHDPTKIVELYANTHVGGELVIYMDIEEEHNVYSRIRISSYREFELTGNPCKNTLKVAENVKHKFYKV